MTDPTPNPRQRALIEATDGVYLVDAGPGTGKTFAVARRYAAIIDEPDVEPEDVLLVTFTRNAATEMRDRIVDRSAYGVRRLRDAPIQTFHSFCHDLLFEHGAGAPAHLGFEHPITSSTRVIEDELLEDELFSEFFSRFRDEHPEHADFYRIIEDAGELQTLIDELTAKGIVPTAAGWYRDGERQLRGDREAFGRRFTAANAPRGNSQSKLRHDLMRRWRDRTFLPDAPSRRDLCGGRGTKQLDEDWIETVFDADRSRLFAFVHDVYRAYLRFALERNYLTFGMLQVFAYVLLCEDGRVREATRFSHVMIDEFQDSSEIQFKLALLVAGPEHFCVVGDWKQSIYGFQYADVRNVTAFEERLARFQAALNRDARRVVLGTEDVETIELRRNYRSTQSLIDFAETALAAPARGSDRIDPDDVPEIVGLAADTDVDNTTIRGVTHEDEPAAVLALVQDVVGNDEYAVRAEDDTLRPPSYGDVAVLTRTRSFGRELVETAGDHAFPMAYEGGIELFRTDPAKLLLAWLRILTDDADRGWALVLEEAGYGLDEIRHVLETGAYPADMLAFRDSLGELASVGAVARRVFTRYGVADERSDELLDVIQSLYDATTFVPGELAALIERGIEHGTTVEVDTSAGDDTVTVQTIHAAKGLEYPIVIMANMNDGAFPPSSRASPAISYDADAGLRQHERYAAVGAYPHVYDDWRTAVIGRCLGTDYDEERRLLYVGITRAEQHVLFTCGSDPNRFFETLVDESETIDPTIDPVAAAASTQTELPFGVARASGPVGHSPHTLMDAAVFEDGGEADALEADPQASGAGMAYGATVHAFAESYAAGEDVAPSNADEERIAAFLDRLPGTIHVEEPVRLPVSVDGQAVMLTGVVDLVHETDDRVTIVDYKTDASRRAEGEYRKQLSVYYHVLADWFPDRDVTARVFYTSLDELVAIEPMPMVQLEELVARHG